MKRDKRRKSIRAADQGERSSRVSSSRPRRRSARTQGGDTRRRGGGASKAQKVLLVANHSRRKHKGKTGTARNRNKKKGGFAKLGRNAEKGVCLSGKTHIPLLSLCRCLLFFSLSVCNPTIGDLGASSQLSKGFVFVLGQKYV